MRWSVRVECEGGVRGMQVKAEREGESFTSYINLLVFVS